LGGPQSGSGTSGEGNNPNNDIKNVLGVFVLDCFLDE
jgi:hypothetical protein